MSKGYLSSFVNDVKAADQKKIGVRLALLCISNDIPVTDVAEYFGVTRMTIYTWFRGKNNVPEKHHVKMQKLIDKLS
jgi:transcriptional regulator with XRE-family HTH domain